MHIRNIHAHPWLLTVLMVVAATYAFAGMASAQPDMSATGLYSTFVAGEGDAYSNILLNQIFGPIFPAPDGAGTSAEGHTLFSKVVGYFNAAMLVVAGLMFFNNLAMGTVQSAHEGEVMGRNWSSLWAPLRTVFAVALLIPLPHMGNYNTAQVFVAFIAKNATNFASATWSLTVREIVTGVVPVSAPRATIPQGLASEMFMLEMCRAILDDQFAQAASSPAAADRISRSVKQVTYKAIQPIGMDHPYRTEVSYDRVSPSGEVIKPGICGTYRTPDIPDVINNRVTTDEVDTFSMTDIASADIPTIRNDFENLHFRAMGVPNASGELVGPNKGLAGDLADIADAVYANYKAREGEEAGSGGASTEVLDITSDLQDAIEKANAEINAGYVGLMARINADGTRNAAIRDAMVNRINTTCEADSDRACMGEGWIGAGAWYMMIARLNNEISSLFSAEGEASASTSARHEANDYGWFRGLFANDEQTALAEQFASANAYASNVFNTSANNLAAAGWTIDPALVNNIAKSVNGSILGDGVDIDDAFRTTGVKASINSGITQLIQYMNDQTFSQDPMIAIVNIGNGFVTVGSLAVFADIFLPGDLASTLGSVIATAGAAMAIILPMMPFLFWIMAVTGYFLLVVEAFIAVNLWAISHLRMDGEGITGGVGREGWLMILALMTTPFLMVAGYLVGMIIFRISSALVSSGLAIAMSGLLGNSNPLFTLVASFVLVVFITIFYMLLIERSFSLIGEFPAKVLRWMGATAHLDTSGTDRVRAGAAGALAGFNRGAGGITKGMNYGPFQGKRGGDITGGKTPGALPPSGKGNTSGG